MTTPAWFTRELAPGESGSDVAALQAVLGAPQTGVLDGYTEALIRGVQRAGKRDPDGVVDEATAALIGERQRVAAGLPPSWFAEGHLERAWEILGTDDPDALRRFQGTRNLPTTGELDARTAIHLGE